LLSGLCFGQCAFVRFPDTVQAHRIGETLAVPIYITGHSGLGVISADMTVSFSERVLTATGYCQTGGAVPSGWMAYANPLPDSLLIAMAGADPLVGSESLLVTLKFVVDDTGLTQLWFARCRLNEGSVPCSTRSSPVGTTEMPGRSDIGGQSITLSPNPSQGRVMCRYTLSKASAVRLVLFDAGGRKVLAVDRAFVPAGSQVEGLDISRLRAGVYILRLEAAGLQASEKLLVGLKETAPSPLSGRGQGEGDE
jgi:hypothetical protein